MKYLVEYKEVIYSHAYVEADTVEEAEAKVRDNDGVESTTEDDYEIEVYEITEVKE